MRNSPLNTRAIPVLVILLFFSSNWSQPVDNSGTEDKDNVKEFGFLSFTIAPGFKRIRIDKETTIGFSENILVSAGTHFIEIVSPQGYADSTFHVFVRSGETVKQTIRLRNQVSGQLAEVPIEAKSSKKERSAVWKYIQVSTFSIGAVASLLAYRQDLLAQKSRKEYDALDHNSTQEEFEKKWSKVKENIDGRNALAGVGAINFAIGLVIWIF